MLVSHALLISDKMENYGSKTATRNPNLQMRIHHRCHMMWISALALSVFGCAAGPDHTPSEAAAAAAAGPGAALRTSLKLQATMNLNGLRHQGSQESFILDNALRKKCSLWYRRSLRGSSDRTRQNMGSLPRVHKVGQVIQCVCCCSHNTHTHNHFSRLNIILFD